MKWTKVVKLERKSDPVANILRSQYEKNHIHDEAVNVLKYYFSN